MASSFLRFLLLISLFFFSAESSYQPPKPNLLVLPVLKDASSGLHWAYIHKRTPLVRVPVLVDLNSRFLWVTCDQHYLSSTYTAPFCHSTLCSRANTHLCYSCASAARPGCHNNTCGLVSINPVTLQSGVSELAQDLLAIQTPPALAPSKPGSMVTVPQFLFACSPSSLLRKGLPNIVQGVAGLGNEPISLPLQLASHFGLQRRFTLCLSGDPGSNGFIFFGEQPNLLRPRLDISRDLVYTPLTVTPQGEYHVRVTSIKVNNQVVVPVSPSLVSALAKTTRRGLGGTMITTASPYTLLHSSIFEALVQVYANQIPKQGQVKAVEPFGLCMDWEKMNKVPDVELVFNKASAVWRISGENLMVEVRPGVRCLGFVNGGDKPRAAITIGVRQLQDYLVVFDLARSMLGFSPSLLSRGAKCASYNFTASP
ncbi:basic 7S globulin-like [Prosopis cineraria]|uniref:basic 7S globulin-like n=1 Tax=Prosopis cineraria TaxID=364024 RepID=UPI00240FB33E|nr:basic 7S globulin-like [Prosopis cineraria]